MQYTFTPEAEESSLEIGPTEYSLAPLPVEMSVDRHPARVYLMRLAPGSRPAMQSSLAMMAEILTGGACSWLTMPWHSLDAQHTKALRSELALRYAPATANKMLAALRGTLREAWELGLISAEQYQRAISVRAVRGDRLLTGRALASGEMRALFSSCSRDTSPAGTRDAALLAVLYGSGLRRSEVVALDVADYNEEEGSITVRSGKGNKDRICYTAAGETSFIDRWLRIRGEHGGAIFCAIQKGGKIRDRRLTDRAVLYIVQRRAQQAGVKIFSPHDLRRTMISDLLDAGADISAVQQLAGHANVQTTTRYDRRGESAKKKAAKLLHIPEGDYS
ncbi:MAG: tyrosine-type recombinase/integrase [Chloroflexota bacterium]|nr:tyrosine-type recombinase/integrase [Chloroflexota bacterium]